MDETEPTVMDRNLQPVKAGDFVRVMTIDASCARFVSRSAAQAIIGNTYRVCTVDDTDGSLRITGVVNVPGNVTGSCWLATADIELCVNQQGENNMENNQTQTPTPAAPVVLDVNGISILPDDEVIIVRYVSNAYVWEEEDFSELRQKPLKVLRVDACDSSIYLDTLLVDGYEFDQCWVPAAAVQKVESTQPQAAQPKATPNPAPPPLVAVRRGAPDLVPVRREAPRLVPVARQEASGDANEAEVSVPYVGVATEAPAAPEVVASTTVPVLAGFRVGDVVRIVRAVYSPTDTWQHQTGLVDAEYRGGWNGDAMDGTVGMTGVVTEVNGSRGWVRVVCGVRAQMTRWVYSPMSLELVSRETVPALVPVQRSARAVAQAPTAYKYVTIGGACETEVVLLLGVHDTSRVTLFYRTPPYELRKEILGPLCRATGADLEETLSKDIYATSGASLGQGCQPGVTKISEILRVTVLDREPEGEEDEDDDDFPSTTTDLFWLTEYKVEVDAEGRLNLDLSNVADTFFSL